MDIHLDAHVRDPENHAGIYEVQVPINSKMVRTINALRDNPFTEAQIKEGAHQYVSLDVKDKSTGAFLKVWVLAKELEDAIGGKVPQEASIANRMAMVHEVVRNRLKISPSVEEKLVISINKITVEFDRFQNEMKKLGLMFDEAESRLKATHDLTKISALRQKLRESFHAVKEEYQHCKASVEQDIELHQAHFKALAEAYSSVKAQVVDAVVKMFAKPDSSS